MAKLVSSFVFTGRGMIVFHRNCKNRDPHNKSDQENNPRKYSEYDDLILVELSPNTRFFSIDPIAKKVSKGKHNSQNSQTLTDKHAVPFIITKHIEHLIDFDFIGNIGIDRNFPHIDNTDNNEHEHEDAENKTEDIASHCDG